MLALDSAAVAAAACSLLLQLPLVLLQWPWAVMIAVTARQISTQREFHALDTREPKVLTRGAHLCAGEDVARLFMDELN